MIAATAVCGMVYAAFAGQPLTIIGSTGPVLAFIAVLYKTSIRMVRRKGEGCVVCCPCHPWEVVLSKTRAVNG